MSFTEKYEKHRSGHESISKQIASIRDLYSDSNIRISKSHPMHKILQDAEDVALIWSKGNVNKTDMNKLFSTLHVDRIHNSVKCLKFENNKNKYLKDLLNGSLDFFDRKISHAKSILWELEAYTKIKKEMPAATLDEPDVIINIDELSIALPCKKTFSEKGVEKVLSNAVSQIERRHEFGIVAINIDDLIPAGSVLKRRTFKDASDRLHAQNIDFLSRQERHFQKYLKSSRIVAVVVSTSMVADITEERPKFNNLDMWTIWTIPDLKKKHKLAINKFSEKVVG